MKIEDKSQNSQTVASAAEPLLTTKQAALFFGVRPNTLELWRLQGKGPRYCRISEKTIRYRLADIVEFIEASMQTCTSDRGNS